MVAPLLTTRYLPFTDAPEHAAVMATLAHWRDPIFSGPYALAWEHAQYLPFHVAGALLTALVGDAELACRLVLAGAGIALPLAFRALLRAAGRDPRLAIFACLVFWSRPLVIGFLPFVCAIPLALYALARVFAGLRPQPTGIGGSVGLGALALVLFATHVSAWTAFGAAALPLIVAARRWRLALAVAPSALAAGLWALAGRVTLGEGSLADAGEISRMGVGRALLAMPTWVFDVWRSHGDDVAAVAWWVGFLAATALSVRALGRYPGAAVVRLYLPFAGVLALYLATPFRVGAGLMLNVRLAPLLVLLALLPARLPRRGWRAAVPIGAALVASLVGGLAALSACRRERAALGDLDGVLAPIGPGARLLTLNFDIRPTESHIDPWVHVGAYHRVRRGGVSTFSFSELHHWPLRYRPEAAPPRNRGATWGRRSVRVPQRRDRARLRLRPRSRSALAVRRRAPGACLFCGRGEREDDPLPPRSRRVAAARRSRPRALPLNAVS
jgi:hypothetical protein